MKHTPFFFAFFLPSPEWEAFRRVKQNAKTNNKASQIGGLFIDNKGNTMTSENPLLALREKSARWMKNY